MQVPATWKKRRVCELFEIKQGISLGAHRRTGDPSIPFLRTSNVYWGRIVLDDVDRMMATEEEVAKFDLRAGDVLVCEGGDIGRTALVDHRLSGIVFQNHLHRLRAVDNSVDPEFFVHWMNFAWNIAKAFQGTGNKTTIPNLSQSRLGAIEIPVPSSEVQREIAAILRAAHLAKYTAEQIVTLAITLKSVSLRHVFETDTTGRGFVDTPDGPMLAAWPRRRLIEVADIQSGLTKGRSIDLTKSTKTPYLRVANVQDGRLDLREIKSIEASAEDLERFSLRPGDVLMTEGGDEDKLGRGTVWRGQISPCLHQNHVFAVRPHQTELLPDFLAYVTQSPYGRSYFFRVSHRTTNLACINRSKLSAFLVPLPPLDEQRRVVEILSAIDARIDAERRRLAALEDLYRTLLHGLMTGALRVDDPAVAREAAQLSLPLAPAE